MTEPLDPYSYRIGPLKIETASAVVRGTKPATLADFRAGRIEKLDVVAAASREAIAQTAR